MDNVGNLLLKCAILNVEKLWLSGFYLSIIYPLFRIAAFSKLSILSPAKKVKQENPFAIPQNLPARHMEAFVSNACQHPADDKDVQHPYIRFPSSEKRRKRGQGVYQDKHMPGAAIMSREFENPKEEREKTMKMTQAVVDFLLYKEIYCSSATRRKEFGCRAPIRELSSRCRKMKWKRL